jgi:predicted GNAT family N-acyltransferase
LRRPIGLSLFEEDLAQEQSHDHFGLFADSGSFVACVIAIRLSATEAKIRQMAVSPAYQRQGHGTRIICQLEDRLAASGIHRVSMHARVSAVEFYRSLGYSVTGTEFSEVGIPHVEMEKFLKNTPTDVTRAA